MSWLYSQEMVEGLLGEISLDGAQFVPWKLKNTHVGYSCKDKMTERSILSLYGRTLEVSPKETTTAGRTSNTSKESLITLLFPAVSLARIYQWQEKVRGLVESAADCGENTQGWLAKYDPKGCMWKTAQCSLLGDYTEFSGTWPKWGIMLHGVCWPLRTLEPTTKGTGYGYLPGVMIPTPTKGDAGCGSIVGKDDTFTETKSGSLRKHNRNGHSSSIGLARMVQVTWPTPQSSDGKSGGAHCVGRPGYQTSLNDIVLKFPTPTSSPGGMYAEDLEKYPRNTPTLATVAKYPTPNANPPGFKNIEIVDKNGEPPKGHNERWYDKNTGRLVQKGLEQVVKKSYPTPAAQDGKNSTLPVSQTNRDSIPGQLLKDGAQPGAQLNPDWVELLMMWPLGWTNIEPQAINLQEWFECYNLDAHLTNEWEQDVPRVGVDIPHRIKRIEGIGNGQVPFCAAGAYLILESLFNP